MNGGGRFVKWPRLEAGEEEEDFFCKQVADWLADLRKPGQTAAVFWIGQRSRHLYFVSLCIVYDAT